MSLRGGDLPPLPAPYPPVTMAFRVGPARLGRAARWGEGSARHGLPAALLNHSLSTMFLAPALAVSHFGPGRGQTSFKNTGFGWRAGETACSSQAVKTGQFRGKEHPG
jgi:hypothetical protein